MAIDPEQGGRRGDIPVRGEEGAQGGAQRCSAVTLRCKWGQIALLQRADQQIVLKNRCEQGGVRVLDPAASASLGDGEDGLGLTVGDAPADEPAGGFTEGEA